jgi:4-hydroxy-tetrahydrodipicolinate synthase
VSKPLANDLGRGVIPPLVTPWTADGGLDEAGLRRLVEKQVAAGVHGLFVLGTTGEGPALPPAARQRVVEVAVDASAGRRPVLVGVTDTDFATVETMTQHAADQQAAAVVVAPPPYSPLDAPELNAYLDRLAESLPLPMFLYNIPSRTGAVPMASVRHAMTLPNCIGFKDSSGSMIYLHEAILLRDEHRPDFRVLVGPEELLAEAVLFGADGGVAGGANLFPTLFVALYDTARRGDVAGLRPLQRTVMQLSTTLYRAGRHPSSFIKAVKRGLERQGICAGQLADPYGSFAPADHDRVDRLVDQSHDLVNETLNRLAATTG